MIRMSISRAFVLFALLTLVWPLRLAVAQNGKTGVDMKFTLTNGHVRTPPFKVQKHRYWVDLWVKTDLPYDEWCCVTKADKVDRTLIPNPACTRGISKRIQATWTLWDGTRLVAQGPSEKNPSMCNPGAIGIRDFFLGSFDGKGGKTYVLDVDFTNVDSSLHFTNTRLKVWPQPEM